MSFDLKLFSDKLKRCRTNLQLEINEVANKIGISNEQYIELEGGRIIPSGDEILILADFYKLDYQYLISNQLEAASEKIQILYRKFGNQFSKEDRWTVQEFIYLCECEQMAFELNDFRKKEFFFKPSGAYFKGHSLNAAVNLRSALSLKPDQLIKDIYYELRKLGIHIFRRKLVNSEISGLFIMHPWAGKCILINYDEDIYRQNFTIAHEIGHAIFDSGEEVNVSHYSDLKGRNLIEIRANTFASNFLIPKEALQKFAHVKFNAEHITNLAYQLKVNVTPLVIALSEQGLLDADQQKEFMGLRLSKGKKIDPELEGLSEKTYKFKMSLLERGLSSFYVNNVHEAYIKGHISAGKLAEMLLVSEKQLIAILKLYNLELNYEY